MKGQTLSLVVAGVKSSVLRCHARTDFCAGARDWRLSLLPPVPTIITL